MRAGSDLTVLTAGRMRVRVAEAAELLAGEDVSCEVIDARYIWPLDTETLAASLGRTGKLAVVHEPVEFCGWGAEAAAWAFEHAFEQLDAPVVRVGSERTPIPFQPHLEDEARPDGRPHHRGAARAGRLLMRFAVDTGGTFTDLVVEDDDGALSHLEGPTTPADPVAGILDAFSRRRRGRAGSRARSCSRGGSILIHGTTRAHQRGPDRQRRPGPRCWPPRATPTSCVLREGGRTEPFNFSGPIPSRTSRAP